MSIFWWPIIWLVPFFIKIVPSDQVIFVEMSNEKDQQYMANAVVISDRFYWRNMVTGWDCAELGNKNVDKSEETKKLKGICANWKLKALAADAYVKSWKCKQKDGAANEINDLECLCVKPMFRIASGELLLCSAMVAIMAVYRDLFGWGKGAGLKREILFVNQEAWESVDRWVKLYQNAGKMLKIAKNEIEKDEHFEEYKMLPNFSYETSPFWPNYYAFQKNRKSENEEEGTKNIIENFLLDLKKELQNFETMNKIMMEKVANGQKLNDLLEDMTETDEIYEKIWDLSQELGFDMMALCKAGKEIRAKYGEKKMKDTAMSSSSNTNSPSPSKLRYEQQKIEKELGRKLLMYKEAIHDPLLKQMDAANLLKSLHDPCEEAELKVKKCVVKKKGGDQ